MAVHTVVVDVMLKPEILDPAGQAVLNALPTLGLPPARTLRIGKHIELSLEAEDERGALEAATKMAETLLANPVIEDFRVRLAGEG
jgi:phosphoribosylformylglycinamidine synthase PurS subunit